MDYPLSVENSVDHRVDQLWAAVDGWADVGLLRVICRLLRVICRNVPRVARSVTALRRGGFLLCADYAGRVPTRRLLRQPHPRRFSEQHHELGVDGDPEPFPAVAHAG